MSKKIIKLKQTDKHYLIVRLHCRFTTPTTGFGRFARSRILPAKATLHSAKPLPGAAPSKDPPAKNWLAKISLPEAFYRAPGKDFAESKPSPRQRKVTVTAPAPSVLFLPGAVSETPGKDFLIFFLRYSLPRALWVGSRQSFFLNNFFARCLVPDTRQRFLFYFLTITLPGALA